MVAFIWSVKDNWTALEEALRKFIQEELARGGKQTVPGLDPRLHAPFFGTLKEEELYQLPIKEYVSGAGFYYRGRNYRLKLIDDIRSVRNGNHLRLLSGRFIMPRLVALRGREIFIDWYAGKAADWVPRRVQLLQDRVGIKPQSIDIRDLRFVFFKLRLRDVVCRQASKLCTMHKLILRGLFVGLCLDFFQETGYTRYCRCTRLMKRGKTVRFRHKPVLAVSEGCGGWGLCP